MILALKIQCTSWGNQASMQILLALKLDSLTKYTEFLKQGLNVVNIYTMYARLFTQCHRNNYEIWNTLDFVFILHNYNVSLNYNYMYWNGGEFWEICKMNLLHVP